MGFFDKLFGRKDLTLREPGFAGMLYPADADALRDEISELLNAAERHGEVPRALIVPQGDYDFVGPVLAAGWIDYARPGEEIERVVVVGSSRLVPFRGLAITGYDGFQTPLGPLVCDRDEVRALARLEQVRAIEPAFDPETSVEVQLPFIHEVLGEVALVPTLVGDATDEEVEEVISQFIDDPAALVVVSANLSHDVSCERAEELDDETQQAIEALEPEAISREHSAGRIAVRGLLRAAKKAGLRAETLARSTSADAAGAQAGPVTGYGAFGFYA